MANVSYQFQIRDPLSARAFSRIDETEARLRDKLLKCDVKLCLRALSRRDENEARLSDKLLKCDVK